MHLLPFTVLIMFLIRLWCRITVPVVLLRLCVSSISTFTSTIHSMLFIYICNWFRGFDLCFYISPRCGIRGWRNHLSLLDIASHLKHPTVIVIVISILNEYVIICGSWTENLYHFMNDWYLQWMFNIGNLINAKKNLKPIHLLFLIFDIIVRCFM